MVRPAHPKIYHIVHVDRLPSIIASNGLLCDAVMAAYPDNGSMIGMSSIKKRRLEELTLSSHPGLNVGACVPFYFCPRSIMLFLIHKANHAELAYRGGQSPIIHLEADLEATVAWAEQQGRRWAFTLSNAGAYYFEDRADLNQLDEINWSAVHSRQWSNDKEGKQAEFLIEGSFPWQLVQRIGVQTRQTYQQVVNALQPNGYRPPVEITVDWYY